MMRPDLACQQHLVMSDSNSSDDHKERLSDAQALKASGKDNTMPLFEASR